MIPRASLRVSPFDPQGVASRFVQAQLTSPWKKLTSLRLSEQPRKYSLWRRHITEGQQVNHKKASLPPHPNKPSDKALPHSR
jgi:hypothetical protein